MHTWCVLTTSRKQRRFYGRAPEGEVLWRVGGTTLIFYSLYKKNKPEAARLKEAEATDSSSTEGNTCTEWRKEHLKGDLLERPRKGGLFARPFQI